jgi:hypothetical protein
MDNLPDATPVPRIQRKGSRLAIGRAGNATSKADVLARRGVLKTSKLEVLTYHDRAAEILAETFDSELRHLEDHHDDDCKRCARLRKIAALLHEIWQ